MKKNILRALLPACLLIYIVIIWPKSSGSSIADPAENNKAKGASAQLDRSRQPQLKGDPNFKPQVIARPATKKEKHFKTTSPEAQAYLEDHVRSLEEGVGKTPAITKEQIKESKQLQSVIEAAENPQPPFGSGQSREI